MKPQDLSKLLNAYGVIQSDKEHMTHALNCDKCRAIYGGLSDLVQDHINLQSSHAALKARYEKLVGDKNDQDSKSPRKTPNVPG